MKNRNLKSRNEFYTNVYSYFSTKIKLSKVSYERVIEHTVEQNET